VCRHTADSDGDFKQPLDREFTAAERQAAAPSVTPTAGRDGGQSTDDRHSRDSAGTDGSVRHTVVGRQSP